MLKPFWIRRPPERILIQPVNKLLGDLRSLAVPLTKFFGSNQASGQDGHRVTRPEPGSALSKRLVICQAPQSSLVEAVDQLRAMTWVRPELPQDRQKTIQLFGEPSQDPLNSEANARCFHDGILFGRRDFAAI
jgi:hypothetical protein